MQWRSENLPYNLAGEASQKQALRGAWVNNIVLVVLKVTGGRECRW